MGIDLRLLPCEHWSESDGRVWGHSHTILDLGRVGHGAYDSFQELVKPHVTKMPANHDVTSFVGCRVASGRHEGDHVYGTIRATDGYGDPYEFVIAQQLLPWLEKHFRYDGKLGHGPYQASIVAYLRALPPHTKIVLDWH